MCKHQTIDTPFELIVHEIIKREGGYVDDPFDSGGKTRFGITERVARRHGYKDDMRKLPLSLAKNIYRKDYWDALCLDEVAEMDMSLADELMDTGVNQGVSRAAQYLQRALNALNNSERHPELVIDGHIGGKTLGALKSLMDARGKRGAKVLYRMLNCLQGYHYISLAERKETQKRFLFGWFFNRVS